MTKAMTVYVARHGNSDHLKVIRETPNLGLMFTSLDYLRDYKHRFAFDNGAFSSYTKGVPFDDFAFLRTLPKFTGADFGVIPDIVAGGSRSLEYSIAWMSVLPDSTNWYLAVQDGMKKAKIPNSLINKIKGIFVGGSIRWKYETAEEWIQFAHENDLKCHIGRIGTLKGLLFAESIGADSVDSSNYAQHESNWKELIKWNNDEVIQSMDITSFADIPA